MSGDVVKPGYKKTEMGVIPEDWEIERIDRHTSITTGSKNTQDRVDDGEYSFFVRSQHVERINTYSYEGEAVLTAGDGVGTGKVFHYINGRFDVHQRVYRISDFSDQLNGRYFFYQFKTRFFDRIMSMTAKSSVDSVRMEMIAGMQIPIPPLPEQRAIAAALSDADGLIGALETLIAKKRAIKQAAMQQLLTGRTRLPGFAKSSGNKNTEVGVIPEDWKVKRLGDLGTFLKGRAIKRDDISDDGFACIRYGEIYTRYNNYVEMLQSRIPEKIAATALPIKTGDLLFAGSGETSEEIGKCVAYIGDKEAFAGGDVIVLRPTGERNSLYLGHLLNHDFVAQQKARFGQGDAIVHISARNLARVKVPLPSLPEQTAIATVLSNMDAEIIVLEQRLEKVQQIKQGMMQQLLTGKVRLGISAHKGDSALC